MYASVMWKYFRCVLLVAATIWMLAACHTGSRQAARPAPESEQVISAALKELYLKVSALPRQSREQQELVLRMAREASNGKELLLVMRAAVGVFPSNTEEAEESVEDQLQTVVTAKMMKLATIEQLIGYAEEYPVDERQARHYVERMFELETASPDARSWYRIRAAAGRLKVTDLEQQAQTRGDELTAK